MMHGNRTLPKRSDPLLNGKETPKIPSTSRIGNSEDSSKDANGDVKQLYMFLNSIVLQYLEILGLQHTVSTFLQESQDEGYPTPANLTTVEKCHVDAGSAELKHKDVVHLMQCFDLGDKPALLDKWKYVLERCPTENYPEVGKLNVQLKIYAFITIPYLCNYTEDEKQLNIQRLIEEFKSKNHDEFADTEVLSLHALPFVTNPVQHPVFSKFFSDSWIHDTRKGLEMFCYSLCRRLPDPFETDMAKLYRLWFNTNNVMREFNLSYQKGTRSSDTLRLMPGNVQRCCKLPSDSSFKMFFDNIFSLKQENDVLSQSDQSIKAEYMKKIQLCDTLVTCLKDLYMTKGGDDAGDASWARIVETCSRMTFPEKFPAWDKGDSPRTPTSLLLNRVPTPPTANMQFHTSTARHSARKHYDNRSARIRPDFDSTFSSEPFAMSSRYDALHGDNVEVGSARSYSLTRSETYGGMTAPNFHIQAVPPPPPMDLGGRSLIGMLQTNNLLRDIVINSKRKQ